ncbi:MAG: Hsp33 family molecular chaperone HslO [Pseudomonadota bacterium]|nr:Hsp33 family molecular chaperone HslO [Pseudomonadota bacterium]
MNQETEEGLFQAVLTHAPVRCVLVRLTDAWQAARQHRSLPAAARDLLGEAMAATALMTSTLKFSGSLSLQAQTNGPLAWLLCQTDHRLSMRATIRWDSTRPANDEPGQLAITINPDDRPQQYQGLVRFSNQGLAADLEDYYQQSEQLPTRFWFAVNEQRAAGLLVQRLPHRTGDPDAWSRVQHLANTVSATELLDLAPHRLLHRLFHEEGVRMTPPRPLRFQCRCSREKVVDILQMLGRTEVEHVLHEQGEVAVTCEFCGQITALDAVDIAQLWTDFEPRLPGDTPDNVH